jgi:hyperosmotically inducible periplasmic protein
VSSRTILKQTPLVARTAFGNALATSYDQILDVERTYEGYSAMKRPILFFPMAVLSLGLLASPVLSQEPVTSAPADNTGQNVRDKGGDTLTPLSQSESKADIKITADIRRAIVKDKRLSTSARNIKIITDNGRVTLRGPVNTTQESALIVSKARAIAGAGNVNNQLDIANQ